MPTVPSRIHKGVAIAADQLLAERLHHRPVALHDPHVRRGAAQPLLHATRERFELRHQTCARPFPPSCAPPLAVRIRRA